MFSVHFVVETGGTAEIKWGEKVVVAKKIKEEIGRERS